MLVSFSFSEHAVCTMWNKMWRFWHRPWLGLWQSLGCVVPSPQVSGRGILEDTQHPPTPSSTPLHLHTFSSLLLSLPRTSISKCLVCMCGLDFFLSSFSLLPWVFAQNCWIWSFGEWQDFLVLFLSILQIFYCFFMTAVGEQLS